MPVKKTVAKRIRQAEKNRLRNKHYTSMMKSAVKNALAAESKEEAETLGRTAISTIDKVASKGIIHANQAANQKSRVAKHLNSLSS